MHDGCYGLRVTLEHDFAGVQTEDADGSKMLVMQGTKWLLSWSVIDTEPNEFQVSAEVCEDLEYEEDCGPVWPCGSPRSVGPTMMWSNCHLTQSSKTFPLPQRTCSTLLPTTTAPRPSRMCSWSAGLANSSHCPSLHRGAIRIENGPFCI